MLNVPLLVLSAAFAAGWAALSVELWWLRAASASLPGQLPAAALVVPGFLLAWSAGSWWGGRFGDRRHGDAVAAGRWFAWSAMAAWLVPVLAGLIAPDTPPETLVARLAVGAVPALPVAFGLGGALPLLTRVRSAHGLPPARATGAVAAALALGGALGALGFVPLLEAGHDPALGAALALAAAGCTCFLLGLGGERVVGAAPRGSAVGADVGDSHEHDVTARGPSTPLLPVAAFAGGALLVGGQLLLLRVAAQAEGASLLTSAAVLGWLHLGMAVGAVALMPRWRCAAAESLCALLLAVAAVGLAWPGAPGGLGSGLAVALPCLALGCGAGSLVTAASRARRRAGSVLGSWVGDLGACSTLGGVLGGWAVLTAVDGVVGSPTLLRGLALGSAALALALAALGCGLSGTRRFATLALVLALAGGALATAADPVLLPWRHAPDETELLAQVEDRHGITRVVQLASGGRRVTLDGRFAMGGSEHAVLARRLGRIAAAMAPQAERALVLGLGAGHTLAGVAVASPAQVECVERNGALWSLPEHVPPVTGRLPGPLPARGGDVRVVNDDARAWVAHHPDSYDLIVGDLFFPWMSGAGDLLSREHLDAVRRALTEGGVFVQWLPLHQLPWPAFGAAARAFCEAFPTARAFLATPLANEPLVALVGGLDEGLPAVDTLDALLGSAPDPVGPADARELYDLYLTDAWSLLARFGDAPLPTLARPVTELASLGRQDDEALIARRNTRLLADLATPLITTSLARHPIDSRENRVLGLELTVRSKVTQQLLLARAAMLERATLDAARAADRPRLAELDADVDQSLLSAWFEQPGHGSTAAALLERASRLVGEQRWEDAAGLLHEALQRGRDVRLAAMLGGIYTQLGFLDEALALLRGARDAAPNERSVLLNLGAALLFQGGADDEARDALREARELGPLPPLHAVALGLLEGDDTSRRTAASVLDALDEAEAWSLALRRLSSASGG